MAAPPIDRGTPALLTPSNAPHSWWRLHRRIYDWVLGWAESPYGSIALFLLAFAESSFFPVPPDVLLIALVLGSPRTWWRKAALCTAGSVIGGVVGYVIGKFLMDSVGMKIINFYHAKAYYEQVKLWYLQYDVWIVFVAAFTPIPYKVFTIASGAFDMNLFGFTAVSILGRGARFFLVAALLRVAGERMKHFIDRYFDLLAILFVVLLAGGFALIKFVR
ncbi:MAG: DedA family protein [Bryobacterales bacterium]|nr:DedA family protein [Bryobacterales bacterium]